MENRNKVAILGGSGFIGSRLCNRLKSSNVDFCILDIKKSENFPDNWIYSDITKPETIDPALKGVSVIINLAAEHKDNVQPISLYYDVNVTGAKNICAAAERLGINDIIFTSSVAVYGFVDKETGEDGNFNPFNDYGKSKLEAEQVYNLWVGGNLNRKLVTVRPTVVFGEKNRGNVYNLFKQIASGRFVMIGSGNNKKSMAYVENIAAFLECAINLTVGHHIYNYIDKPDYTMNELTNIIYSSLGRENKILRVPYFVGMVGGYLFDILAKLTGKEFPVSSIRIKKFCSRTQFKSNNIDTTGFKAPVPLSQGISNTVLSEFVDK
ncbi:NAD-dependent epimerase/dehydratase family protein [Yersinia ruckeri]|uniref:NAD-dependent epimerase/dehydratase family protein n=1 Tax=Yersinia ruckeri TaxID=29486 RepID=UPI001F410319|nr:NAD-dependent epimerase/dehydratase family protein [Yersinia ruckeri]MCW6547000.1 NAD-dependent epimerase/dehydratase family protein [Yersinia ruckeri]MCW6572098.1 NAD-dependent epimerase/dehydratase family protein [Yersinia ruckeri]UIN01635.1 NAD-dependent epimerase/dehydratase family protein [Yersinia ruckeri]UZX54509.1 NAD-dependent epimerase/dehydratase family protein [Yersinia ruckeri]